MYNKITKNKKVGALLFFMGIAGILILVFRIILYTYEYHPQHHPFDYGRWNVLTYFTIQSNFAACIYFFLVALGMFGNQKAQKIGFNTTLSTFITLYILVAGLVYNSGFLLKMNEAIIFDTFYHSFISVMQLYYHIVVPVVIVALWFFPFKNERLGAKTIFASGIYPLVYSIVSIIRGAYTNPTYYPYPFYNPQFIWETFGSKHKSFSAVGAYGIIGVLLVFGIGAFILMCAILVLIHNKRINGSK